MKLNQYFSIQRRALTLVVNDLNYSEVEPKESRLVEILENFLTVRGLKPTMTDIKTFIRVAKSVNRGEITKEEGYKVLRIQHIQ